jgi:hypothetical protein
MRRPSIPSIDSNLHDQGGTAGHRRIFPQYHSRHSGGGLRRRRDPAGSLLRHLVRICALFAWERGKPLLNLVVFGVVGIIMRVAPLGAFGAMAFPHGLSRGIWQATKASLRGPFKRALLWRQMFRAQL